MSEGAFTDSKYAADPITLDKMLMAVSVIHKAPTLPENRKIGLFEKLMNKVGWFRQREIYIIKEKDFRMVGF